MNTLNQLLIILGGQKLTSGYLTSAGSAHDTVRALRQQFDPYTLISNPLGYPVTLLTPAWVASLQGKDAIFLAGVNGQLDLSKNPQPAYTLG